MDRAQRDADRGGSLASVEDEAFPPWLDAASVAMAVALAVGSAWGVTPHGRLPVAVLSALAAAPIARVWATSWAASWSLLTLGALAVINVAGPEWGWLWESAGSQMSLLLGLWIVLCDAVVLPLRKAAATALGLCAVVTASGVVISFGATVVWIPGILLAFVGGRLLHSLAWAIVRTREAESALASQALADSQRSVAREVHDVVAHSLSVTALQLTAARMAARRGDLAATEAALGDAERLIRTSLRDLRRTVRLLRGAMPWPTSPAGDSVPAVPSAAPGLAELDDLVGSFRSVGLAVALRVDATVGTAGQLTELAAYRVVQEALTNVTRYQVGAEVTVTVVGGDDSLCVEVASRGERVAADAGGLGLLGMRERVEALGGELQAGPTPEGWCVAVGLPLDGPSGTLTGPAPDDVGALPA